MGIVYKETTEFHEAELFRLFDSVGWVSARYAARLVKAMRGSSAVISAWDGGRLVGLVNALDDGELTAYIHYLLVDPAYQGQGIGRHLACAIRNRYAHCLYTVLIVEDTKNIPFYEKLGFRVTAGATPMDVTHY